MPRSAAGSGPAHQNPSVCHSQVEIAGDGEEPSRLKTITRNELGASPEVRTYARGKLSLSLKRYK